MALTSKTVTVSVTIADIATGRPRAYDSCPVALAIKRTTYSDQVVADPLGFYVNGQPARPDSIVIPFMELFDDDANRPLCKPFDFALTYWERQP